MLYFMLNPFNRVFNGLGYFKNFTAKKSIGFLIIVLALAFVGCKSDSTETDPIIDVDTDGDGISDTDEVLNGSNKNNPCDPKLASGYSGYDKANTIWLGADCDTDGITNAQELVDGSDPFVDELKDGDGDGIPDFQEIVAGTDKDSACDPVQNEDYTGYDASSSIWANSDCDGDGVSNGDEVAANTNPYLEDLEEMVFAKAEFLPTLSEVQLFRGNPSELVVSSTTLEYSLITPLYSDYAHKFRTISLPEGTQMTYNGEGLLEFPDNTVISKTFYYFRDERDPSLGKKLIETRLLIKKDGVWNLGNYLWNDEQNEAFLGTAGPIVPVQWVDMSGNNRSADYQVPNAFACVQCHNKSDTTIPIGPKARNLNFTFNGKNQLQNFVDLGLLADAPEMTQIETTPDWSDNSLSLEERTRAYMDINCAHCHQPGGQHDASIADRPDLRYETSFEASHISDFGEDIKNRVGTPPGLGTYSMPQLGATQLHTEGVALIQAYIDSLE
ncbi:conserved hypothetical protein, HNE_0200 family [Pricia antarctica]|uniref:Cytochrome c domain-containing protein n=1 Tax=Pricia antarctica TaxID=641691 RepID=A0A1G7DN30_9FLAO|nr:hypothetical protein [Pricia antarctica]SDE52903.1 conserved hypothetical protein, HNE_0200 family [Pricia antarctica]